MQLASHAGDDDCVIQCMPILILIYCKRSLNFLLISKIFQSLLMRTIMTMHDNFLHGYSKNKWIMSSAQCGFYIPQLHALLRFLRSHDSFSIIAINVQCSLYYTYNYVKHANIITNYNNINRIMLALCASFLGTNYQGMFIGSYIA